MATQEISFRTKESRHAALQLFLAKVGLPMIDGTDFSKGSKVVARSQEFGFSVEVSLNHGLSPIFSGYGWSSTLTDAQKQQVERTAEAVNRLARFEDPTDGMSPEEAENWKGWGHGGHASDRFGDE